MYVYIYIYINRYIHTHIYVYIPLHFFCFMEIWDLQGDDCCENPFWVRVVLFGAHTLGLHVGIVYRLEGPRQVCLLSLLRQGKGSVRGLRFEERSGLTRSIIETPPEPALCRGCYKDTGHCTQPAHTCC